MSSYYVSTPSPGAHRVTHKRPVDGAGEFGRWTPMKERGRPRADGEKPISLPALIVRAPAPYDGDPHLIRDLIRAKVDPDLVERVASKIVEARVGTPIRTKRQERNRRYYLKRKERLTKTPSRTFEDAPKATREAIQRPMTRAELEAIKRLYPTLEEA